MYSSSTWKMTNRKVGMLNGINSSKVNRRSILRHSILLLLTIFCRKQRADNVTSLYRSFALSFSNERPLDSSVASVFECIEPNSFVFCTFECVLWLSACANESEQEWTVDRTVVPTHNFCRASVRDKESKSKKWNKFTR